MSEPRKPDKAKLIVGIFTREKDLALPFARELERAFGPTDMVSRWIPFDFTKYYESEMGGPLFRRMFAFRQTVEQGALADIKTLTNQLEKEFTENDARRVNADPGILSLERFVLATGKNFTHRIYLKKGVYADLTLVYTKGAFRELPWTYPDYKDRRLLRFLEKAREKYVLDIKSNGLK
jgi:hypothetical protein